MLKILKADFRKFFSGKLFIAMAVLGIVFPLLSAGLYRFALKNISEGPFAINAETAFFGSFSPLNNYGLMLMIFMIIIVLADFNQNTIRNKIVAGYSKNTVYLASTIFTLSIAFIATSVHTFLTYLLTKYLVGSSGDSFGIILRHWTVGILATMTLYAFLQFLAFVFKSFGATFGVLLGSLLFISIAFYALSIRFNKEVMDVILIVITPLQLFKNSSFDSAHIPWMIFSNAGMLGLIIGLGLYLNKKLDYK